MGKDQLFDRKIPVGDFTFDDNVADVFDDMLNRSVPMYGEVQRMLVELALNFAQPKTNIYDLGCSTGTTLVALGKHLEQIHKDSIKLTGVDLSSSMLAKSKEKLEKNNIKDYALIEHDLNESLEFTNASCIFLTWTLQFLRPVNRPRLLNSIYNGLNDDGVLIMVEKVVAKSSLLNRLFIDLYYNFKKRQGYSDLEISKKREALENVLVPYQLEENCELLTAAGFESVDVFFKWYNFCGIIAQKRSK